MKRFYVTAVIAGAMFFSVGTVTAQETATATATAQVQEKEDFKQIDVQELPGEVSQSVERDFQGATISEAYSKEKDGETKFKLVVTTAEGESKELYADAQGNWIDKEKDSK
ncbi:hypothetical protein GCM10007103_27650 [Salinimicrobium marinum]|uniref:Beta-lactamase-inhibitor-like, PepSY-like n=1 Tax=Salinimicrobium marinum TaxID=680283 RepID=A0A918W103_9FLAO|nr:hypothetical protein [Salinimicrobium marinum]GHA44942.1 hypothetical protein GCM10007103_27650 [Salinimicrobium marinum]